MPTSESETVVEEFTVVDESSPLATDGGVGSEVENVFSAGSESVFRLSRDASQTCVCERIEAAGCPVREVSAVDGELRVGFFARDRETLQSVLDTLGEVYDGLNVRRLLWSGQDDTDRRPILVDTAVLTERQREVLTTAHEMGYFDHPKGANASEVAEELDITASTINEHLAAAQRNLLDELADKWT
jgi:predicted DNA binding protein